MTVFNVGKVSGREYIGSNELERYCVVKSLPIVPWIETGPEFNYTLEELLEKADLQKYDNGSQCEGIVIRSIDETFSEALQGRMSFKVISNKFAVKHGE